jgi:hypothetical protein
VLGDRPDTVDGPFSRKSIFLVVELLFQRLDGSIEATLAYFSSTLWMWIFGKVANATVGALVAQFDSGQ